MRYVHAIHSTIDEWYSHAPLRGQALARGWSRVCCGSAPIGGQRWSAPAHLRGLPGVCPIEPIRSRPSRPTRTRRISSTAASKRSRATSTRPPKDRRGAAGRAVALLARRRHADGARAGPPRSAPTGRDSRRLSSASVTSAWFGRSARRARRVAMARSRRPATVTSRGSSSAWHSAGARASEGPSGMVRYGRRATGAWVCHDSRSG